MTELPALTPEAAYAEIKNLVARGAWLGIDTETTGLTTTDQVVELAIVDPLGTLLFESLSRPTVPIPPEVSSKTGIWQAEVEHAPSWAEVWGQASQFLAGREVVAFNSGFDSEALAQTCAAHGVPLGTRRWTCAQQLLSPLWTRGHVSLAQVCQDLGVVPGTHRAAADARAMVQALLAVAAAPMVVRVAPRSCAPGSAPSAGRS